MLLSQGISGLVFTLRALVLRRGEVSVLGREARPLRSLIAWTETVQRVVCKAHLRKNRHLMRAVIRRARVRVQLAQSPRPRSQRIFDVAIAIRKVLDRANLSQIQIRSLDWNQSKSQVYLSAALLRGQSVASLPR